MAEKKLRTRVYGHGTVGRYNKGCRCRLCSGAFGRMLAHKNFVVVKRKAEGR